LDFSTIATMLGMPVEELIKLIGLIALSSFVLMLVMGMTNRVVIFSDGKDLLNSLGIIITPIIAFILLLYFEPENTPVDYDILWGSTSSSGIVIIATLCVAYCIIMSYAQAIKHNNFFLGAVVGTFKVVSSLIITLCAIGWLNKMFGNQYRTIGTWIVMTLLLGLFGWVIRKLVNGEAVTLKRLRVQQEQQAA